MWTYSEIKIHEIESMLNDYEIEVESPDGYVPVVDFVHKGEYEEYILATESGKIVRVNENHLFETINGWKQAKNLIDTKDYFITNTGIELGKVIKTNNLIPIVDIQVNHPNHRYYTNGVSSHNTGVGKSLFMCHCAAGNLLLGKNVLYITLEMAEEKIAERIDANLMDVTIDELHNMSKSNFDLKINKLKEKTIGRLIIKEYPTAAASSANFRALINELKIKKNFIPDIIYIDYLNICASARIKPGSNINSYGYVKAIAEEIRGLAIEFDVPVVTATQTNRNGANNSDVELTDTSESFGVPMSADIMFALVTSEELESLNQIMVKQLKNRYDDPSRYRRFVIGVDRPKMRLYDVEESAQDDLMDDKPIFDKGNFNRDDENKFDAFKI